MLKFGSTFDTCLESVSDTPVRYIIDTLMSEVDPALSMSGTVDAVTMQDEIDTGTTPAITYHGSDWISLGTSDAKWNASSDLVESVQALLIGINPTGDVISSIDKDEVGCLSVTLNEIMISNRTFNYSF